MLSKLHYFVNALKALVKSILESLENGFCDCEIQFVRIKILLLERKENRQPKHFQRREMMAFWLPLKSAQANENSEIIHASRVFDQPSFLQDRTAFFRFTGMAESPRCSNPMVQLHQQTAQLIFYHFQNCLHMQTLQNASRTSLNVKIAQSFKSIWKTSHIQQ